jgi:pimeloyl-ACP methyl ester carboxylesterase
MRLVLLPGLDKTGELFQSLLKFLPPRLKARVVSYPSQQFLSYKKLVPLVEDALPHTEPFVLLGESFGGPLSIEIAARQPANLRAVILCASFILNPLPPSLTWVAWIPRPLIAMMGNLSPPDIFVRFFAA